MGLLMQWALLVLVSWAQLFVGARPVTIDNASQKFYALVVIVPAVGEWPLRRQLMRTQWPRNMALMPNPEENPVLFKFAMGLQGVSEKVLAATQQEATRHQDMIFLQCPDYDGELNNPLVWNLDGGTSSTTCKLLLSAQWAVQRFKFDYFIRLGDDSYMRPDRIVPQLASGQYPREKAVIGAITYSSGVRLLCCRHPDMLFLPCPDLDGELNNPKAWGLDGGTSSTTCKLLKAAEWAVGRFAFDFFMRLGDDAYMRPDVLVPQLTSGVFPKRKAVIGAIGQSSDLFWPKNQMYAQGRGFILTRDLTEWIAKNADDLLDTAPEDVIASQWFMAFGAHFVQHPGFREALSNDQCDPDFVLIHKLEVELWPTINEEGLCNRTGYTDYNKPPDK